MTMHLAHTVRSARDGGFTRARRGAPARRKAGVAAAALAVLALAGGLAHLIASGRAANGYERFSAWLFPPAALSDAAEPMEASPAAVVPLADAADSGVPDGSVDIPDAVPGLFSAAPALAAIDAAPDGFEAHAAAEPTAAPVNPSAAAANPASNRQAVEGGDQGELQAIAGLLASDPAEAAARLARFVAKPGRQAASLADAWYLTGYLDLQAGKTDEGEAAWERAALDFRQHRGGRLAALALADRHYARFVEETPRFDRYEEIWNLYSIAMGADRIGLDPNTPIVPQAQAAETHQRVKERLTRLVDLCLFGPAPMKGRHTHTLGQNELVGQVARRYGVHAESIGLINRVNPNRVRAGQKLNIVKGSVLVVVRKNVGSLASRERGPALTWFLDGKWVREYPACVGPRDKTPPGEYQVSGREYHPTWYPETGPPLPYGHPGNILGDYWIAIQGNGTRGLGIHGTTDPGSIPGYESAGCIRLNNAHVEELYAFVSTGGNPTRVIILD